MKKIKKTTIFFLFITLPLLSQNNLKKVDKVVSSYKNIPSIENLAKKIDTDFTYPIEKARAAYSWIASNIVYKTRTSYEITPPKIYIVTDQEDLKRRLKKDDEKTALKAFETKSAVCNGYSLLFKKLCDLMGLKNTVVLGYIKNSTYQIGKVPSQKNHAWNAVYINHKWILLDITFASGYAVNDTWQSKYNAVFFDIKKEVMRMTHFPEKPYWRDYLNQEPLEVFSNFPLYSTAFFNSHFEVITPIEGDIKTPKEKRIELKVKGLTPFTKVHYQFGDSKFIRKANVFFRNSVAQISLKNPREDTDLKIYFDRELAIEYKVSVR